MIFGNNSYNNPQSTVNYGMNNGIYSTIPTPQYVAPQYGTTQQYAPTINTTTPLVEPQSAIMVHGIEGARNYIVPKGSLVPLFDDEEDVFYIKTTDPDGMHQRIKKYRFYEEFDGDVLDSSTPLIEQKNTQYGDSLNEQRLDKIEKSIEDLTALFELQLEQSSGSQEKDNKTNSRTTSTTKKTTNK